MRRGGLALLALLAGLLIAAPAASAQTERARVTWNKANDLDLYVYDAAGNVAFYGDADAIPEALLSADVTDSGGPETFTDNQVLSIRSFGYRVCYYGPGVDAGPTEATLVSRDGLGTQTTNTFTLSRPGNCFRAGDLGLIPADVDSDGDTVLDEADNCPAVANAGQVDVDGNGFGDPCNGAADNDLDGIINDEDNCPGIANADQADADADGIGTACDPTPLPGTQPPTLPTQPQPPVQPGTAQSPLPVQGKTVVAGKVGTGTVRIRLKNGKFRSLGANEAIPLGSEVDATKGRVRLTAAAGAGGAVQTADFYKGAFVVTQTKGSKPITQLKLSAKLACPSGKKARSSAKGKKVRRLWGDGKGRFRTRGRNAAATVRGTQWLTEDRCDRTKITVRRGSVTVRDLVKKKTRTVKRGQSYVARRTS